MEHLFDIEKGDGGIFLMSKKETCLTNFNKLGNVKMNEEEGYVLFSVDLSLYPLEVVQAAAYAVVVLEQKLVYFIIS